MDAYVREMWDHHNWYTNLVVRSKLADFGVNPSISDEDLLPMLKGSREGDWWWVLYDGIKVLGWRFPQMLENVRVTDDGAHMYTFAEYKR